jgi:SAM-dependent methyltransferase
MDLVQFGDLLTPTGQEALRTACDLQPREEDFLALFSKLSKRYPADLARSALETAILRREAGRKFPFADQLYFTREALEQATAWEVSTYRAERYRGTAHVLDLGCSAGGDTLALAQVAAATGIDLDPLRLGMAKANLSAIRLEAAWIRADLRQPLPISSANTALFFDPARRTQGRRTYSVNAYQPGLGILHHWLATFPALGVKISPGVKLDELAGYEAEIEFISLHGELKECVLWFGPLRSLTRRRATLLPGSHTLTGTPGGRLPLHEPMAYLYEPDPAVLRAGLVAQVGEQIEAAQMDEDIAYLTGKALHRTPYARVWAVEAWFPFQLKRLRAYLRERGVGRVTVKKRGSPLEPEALIRSLRLAGEAERVVFLTHLRGEPVVIVAQAV